MNPSNSSPNSITEDPELISYIIPDFKALKNISDDFSDDFLGLEEVTIKGFEIYVVEQWACERKIGTLITTFTGNNDNTIKAIKLTVLNLNRSDSTSLNYPKRFQNYLDELFSNHTKLKKLENKQNEFLFITNLSSFPSNLNLLPIPNGDIRTLYDTFNVNVDLRRMKCGGRSGLLLNKPSDASEDKFRQMYKINLKVPVGFAVKELVNIIQICLFYFDLLNPIYGDGLFCNKTEEAIIMWWDKIGFNHFNTRPKLEGSLSPEVVSAIIGLILSVRSRLSIANTDVPKDPFEVENFRLAIGHFQKQQRLERTWKIDSATFERLYIVTNQKANKELKKFTKVVKSTVQDHIGKSTHKLNPWNVETTDIEVMIKHLSGSKLNDLWHGKQNNERYVFTSLADIIHHTTVNGYNSNNRNQPLFTNYNISHNAITKRVDKIRSGLQNRKLTTPREGACSVPRVLGEDNVCDDEDVNLSDIKVKKLGKIENRRSIAVCRNENECSAIVISAEADIMRNLKRRNSYPFIEQEINLKQLENSYSKTDNSIPKISKRTRNRSQSVSVVENPSIDFTSSISSISFNNSLIKTIAQHKEYIDQFENLKTAELSKLEKYLISVKLNYNEIENKFNNINKHQDKTRQNFKLLDLKLSDLDSIIARLNYETRVLSNRIRDVEDNVTQFSEKVNETSLKLDGIYNILLPKNEIYEKFKNPENNDDNNESNILFSLKYYYVMIVDFFIYILMGIDINRVRSLWVKVDPNRRVTNKFYSFLGKDTNKMRKA